MAVTYLYDIYKNRNGSKRLGLGFKAFSFKDLPDWWYISCQETPFISLINALLKRINVSNERRSTDLEKLNKNDAISYSNLHLGPNPCDFSTGGIMVDHSMANVLPENNKCRKLESRYRNYSVIECTGKQWRNRCACVLKGFIVGKTTGQIRLCVWNWLHCAFTVCHMRTPLCSWMLLLMCTQ